MAQLSSPGVSVTVIDESFYTPAAPGTVPLIIVASAENKSNSAGTGTAPGTLKANAGKVYLLTSQMDLGTTFGIPHFETDANNNPVNAGEINEYGLQAAYSLLGVSNRAYVVRSDLDLAQLHASAIAPTGAPADGTFWFDTADTAFGIFQWNAAVATATSGQTFINQTVTVITDTALVSAGAPLSSYGAVGDYAIVATTTLNKLWLKKYVTDTAAGTWVEVGTSSWKASWPTAVGTIANPTILAGDTMTINGTPVSGPVSLTALAAAINTAGIVGVTAAVINGFLNLYSDGSNVVNSGNIVISGTTVAKVGMVSSKYITPALSLSPHYSVPLYKRTDDMASANGFPTGSIWVKTTPINMGANWDIKEYNGNTSTWIRKTVSQLYPSSQAALAALDPNGGGINLALGTVFVKFNDGEFTAPLADFKIYGRSGVGATTITSMIISDSTFVSGTFTFTISSSVVGSTSLTTPHTVSFTGTGNGATDANSLLTAMTAALANTKVSASLNSNNSITISHNAGGDIKLVDGTQYPLASLFAVGTTANFYIDPNGVAAHYVASLWTATSGTTAFAPASLQAPTTTPMDGTLWYNSIVDEVDVMVHDGSKWVGYLNYTQNQVGGSTTDPAGPIVSATQPTAQSDGTELANGDIWISTADLEIYPQIHKYNYLTKKWTLLDNQDQTSESGVLFHDARWSIDGVGTDTKTGAGTSASIAALLSSDFVDFDAPDPALYPKGMLLWNLRRSGNNVLRYVENYVDTNEFDLRYNNTIQTYFHPDRWISEAPNTTQGVGQFGRHAQRAVVVKSLNALINDNQQIRDEDSRIFNIMSCPGYLETLSALTGLNNDRGLLSFIVTDAPARLTPDATSLSNWGSNTANATGDGEDGLIGTDPYSAVYYPWGYTTDLLGNNIVVPPSHIMLRTIALSDNVSYPWFAPAGTRRGGVTNASSVGYVSSTGEFQTVALNTGQRDTLAAIHVNPITYIGGIGLVAYGQKTRQLVASSLDRINVARLVIYLRYQLNQIAKPYIFEPNDTITRNEIRQQIESLMLELTGQRALYDYLVVCDTSNNTPSRIDANELHVDIAIEPVKAVEFIYIPLRLENTGAIKGLGK